MKYNKLTKQLFGQDADFFLQNTQPTIKQITQLDREGRSAVEITFEVEN